MARRYPDEAARGGEARVVDTRKTTPGLRALERYAVRCGGGRNHRGSLSDAVMAKDNHLALLGTGAELTAALRTAKAQLGHTVHFEVEIDALDQLDAVLAAGVDTIMLDNFTLADLTEGVQRIAGTALVEASGNVTLDTVAAIAATGVDVISSGALTHSVRALDLGLDVRVQAPAMPQTVQAPATPDAVRAPATPAAAQTPAMRDAGQTVAAPQAGLEATAR
jgi:nicotinate-nucleotide pyrophosphorylase (carboxylating)